MKQSPNTPSRAFLARAKQRAAEETLDDLLHAALDLRLGIEARLHEYHDAAEEVATLKKRGWQVSGLERGINRAYQLGDKIASLEIQDPTSKEVREQFLYTPVSRRTRQIAERLGDFLHYTERFRPRDEKWVTELRNLVDEGIAGLTAATTGTLLSPLMKKGNSGEAVVLAEVPGGASSERARTMLGKPGDSVTIRVDYLDRIPDGHAA